MRQSEYLSESDCTIATLLGVGETDVNVCRKLGLSRTQFESALKRIAAYVTEPVDSTRPKALCERALRARAMGKLRSVEARFHALMVTAPEAVLVVDGRSGIIREANDRAAQLFGRTISRLIGASVEDLVPDAIRSLHIAYRLGFLASTRRREMGQHPGIIIERPDGSRSTLGIALTSTNDHDDVMVVCTEYSRTKPDPNPNKAPKEGSPKRRGKVKFA